jgi:hypothetical protein
VPFVLNFGPKNFLALIEKLLYILTFRQGESEFFNKMIGPVLKKVGSGE